MIPRRLGYLCGVVFIPQCLVLNRQASAFAFFGNEEINFCLAGRFGSLPLGEGGPLAVDEVNIINSTIAHFMCNIPHPSRKP